MRRLSLTGFRIATFIAVLVAWCVPFVGAHAQSAAVNPDAVRAYALREAASRVTHIDGARIDVQVGAIDVRLMQAPCARLEFALPGGARLWGRGAVIARCTDGSAWSILIPVTVRIHGAALVATRPLPALSPVAADDVRVAEVELTREAQGVVTDAVQLEGRVVARTISAGQPIPLAALRVPQVIGQGDAVKVIGTGRGFSIATDAVAITPALDGQPVRVRTESGRVVTGTARSGRIVEVAF